MTWRPDSRTTGCIANPLAMSDSRSHPHPDRHRRALLAAAGALTAAALSRGAWSAAEWPAIPALASMLAGRALQAGRVHLDIPKLADNGNSVPLTITVDSPMTE